MAQLNESQKAVLYKRLPEDLANEIIVEMDARASHEILLRRVPANERSFRSQPLSINGESKPDLAKDGHRMQ